MAIISRTPFRVSFFGGGTDYPAWYKKNGGTVLATTINKYCYISCRYLPPFFEHKSRIVYSIIENVKNANEIRHPSVQSCLKFMKIKEGLEIHHDGDLPARSGLGSSSSFTVGLLNALHALKGQMVTKHRLATEAIHIEQELIKENVGSQDQITTAFGGLNKINFNVDGSFNITPIILNPERLQELQGHLMLFFTGFSRIASEIAREQINRIPKVKTELSNMHQLADHAASVLTGRRSLLEFGKLLHESWKLKRSLTSKISNSYIDDIYTTARRAGALGGKILGAGGGGFMLIYARPGDQKQIRGRLKKLLLVPCLFENSGSQIVVYNPDGF